MTADSGTRWASEGRSVKVAPASESEATTKPGEGTEVATVKPPAEPDATNLQMFSLASPYELCVFAVGVMGAMGHGMAQPVSTIFFGNLVDLLGDPTMTPDKMVQKVGWVAGILAIFGAIVVCCAHLQFMCFKIFADTMVKRMRVMYLESVLRKDIGWYDVREVAQLPNQISSDIDAVAEAYGDKLAASIMSFTCFVAGYVTAFTVGWELALVLISVLVAIGIGLAFTGRAVKAVRMQTQSYYGQAASVVEECLFAIRTVVAFGGEKRELDKYTHAVVQARRMGVRNGAKAGLGMAWISTVLFAGYALAFYFGGTLRKNDVINPTTGKVWAPGNIITCFFCVLVGAVNLQQVAPGINAWRSGKATAGRFFATVNAVSPIEGSRADTRKELQRLDQFELRKVHFRYPAKPDMKILNGLSLTIKRGYSHAVVGESGSGKSTVMSLLERFYDPCEGQVLVNGEDIKTYSITSVRRLIGYVGQEPVLFATSIRENILQGCKHVTDEDLAQACKDAQLTFVDNLPNKLDTFVGSGGSQFSGGQKQRIAIARALVKKASFLFLDEATSALDNNSEKMIQSTIDSISQQSHGGLGIVSIAHRLSTIQNCDVIFVLSKGVVAEQGTHSELVEAKGLYYALASAQMMASPTPEAAAGAGGAAAADAAGDSARGQAEAKTANTAPGDAAAGGASPTAAPQAGGGAAAPSGLKAAAKEEEDRQKEVLKAYKVPMGRLLSYCKPEWPWFVPAFLGSIVDGASMPAASLILTKAMVAFWYPKDQMMNKVNEVCIAFVIMSGINLVFVTLQNYAFAAIGEAMTQRLRVAILSALFRQEIGYHDDPENTPGMSSRALELYAFRVTTFNRTFGVEVGALSCIGAGIGIAFYYCWQMTLVMLCSIPVLAIAYRLQMLVADGNVKKENETLKTSQQIVVDSVLNARTVHACGSEEDLIHLYDSMVTTTIKGLYPRSFLAACAFGFASGARFFVLAGGFYYGATLIRGGNADFQGVMAAFMGILFAGMGAGRCASMLGDGNKAKLAAHDMFKMLDRQSKINGLEPTGAIPDAPRSDAGNIEFQNVQFFYPFRAQVQVLKGVTFQIKSGTSVGLVGPSGGGKSTVMAMLQRFYDPQGGTVCVGQARRPLSSLNIRWWRRQIGFVGQEPILFNATVRENVMYGLEDGESISDYRLEECKKMANLTFLDDPSSAGWETEVGPRGNRLSGGQKQRVAICRALVRDPPLLLLDEATSALDSQSERVVQEALEAARRGRTSFAIAHRLSTIQGSDVILVVAEGVVVERGNHDELMALQGVYYKLQMQTKQ